MNMFKMGQVLFRDNDHGVSGAELKLPLGTGTYCTPELE